MADSRWRGSKDEGVWGGGSGERGDRGHCEEGGEGHRFREEVSKTEKKKKTLDQKIRAPFSPRLD